MTGIAVVASAHDAKFAEEVRAGLQAAGLDASVSQSLPKAAGPHVVLIWGAALEAGHAIDAQALIGLWSEDRLLVARRDATPLPLGLRDLPSLSPGTTVAEVCAAVPGVHSATSKEHVKFMGREVAKPKATMPVRSILGAIVVIALAGGGAWYYVNKGSLEKQAALTAALETATKASQELQQAQARQQESLQALEEARARETAALKSGDTAKIKEAQEAAKRAEAEAAKQAEAVKQREAAAADARKEAQGAAEKTKTAPKAPEPKTPEPVAKAPEPVAKAPEPAAKAPEPSAKAPEPVAKAEPPKAKSRSEREREEEDRLARQAALKKGVPVASAPPQLSSAEPSTQSAASSPAPSAAASAPVVSTADLFEKANAMEASEPRGAIKIYRSLARNGNGKAAKRLGEIYDKGIPGVSRDYAESLQWYETARKLGETIDSSSTRTETAPAARPAEPEASAAVQPAPSPAPPVVAAIPEVARPEPKSAAAKSAPLVREPARPAPAARAAPPPEPVKKAEPAPATVSESPKAAAEAPPPDPAKIAAPPTASAPERKSDWFSWRGLLIALFVLALIAWRRARRRQKAEARQALSASAAADRRDATALAAARPAQRPQALPLSDATLFVSYSHKDRDRVEPVVSVIEEMGRRVWMDRSDITGQTGWAGQIVRAIRECRAVVLMASPNSYTSDQVVRELYLAMNHRKTIVPIEIEPAEMPDELQYILAPFQHHRLSGRETREVIGRALAAV